MLTFLDVQPSLGDDGLPAPQSTHRRPAPESPLWLGKPLLQTSPGRSTAPEAPYFLTSLDLLVLLTLRYAWEKDGATLGVESNPRIRLDKNGSLHISQTWSGDIGTYTCRVLSAGGNDSRSAHLRVR